MLNGWSSGDIAVCCLIIMLLTACLVPAIFSALTRMTVWGPWAMRDFACLLPPGSLLRAVALFDIGYLHHRSYLFAAALVASYCIDVVRNAAVFASIMTILGNKWYALKGGYLVLFLTGICSSLSPCVGHAIAMAACKASPFDRITLDHSVSGKGSLGEAILWAVVPLASVSYLLQLISLRYFNADILTFKGHGNMLADGSRTGTSSSTRRVSISALKRMRRAVERSSPGPNSALALAPTDFENASVISSAPPGRTGDASIHRHGLQPVQEGKPSVLGPLPLRKQPSMDASIIFSEPVSELEQQILFNFSERQGSFPAVSRASSASRLAAGAAAGDIEDTRLFPVAISRVPSLLSSPSRVSIDRSRMSGKLEKPDPVVAVGKAENEEFSPSSAVIAAVCAVAVGSDSQNGQEFVHKFGALHPI